MEDSIITVKRAISFDIALFYVVPELNKVIQVEVQSSFDDKRTIISDYIINPNGTDKYTRDVYYIELFRLKPLKHNEYTVKPKIFAKAFLGDTKV